MPKYIVHWETDGEIVDLPDEVEIPEYVEKEDYDITEYLSNRYGWLVKSIVKV